MLNVLVMFPAVNHAEESEKKLSDCVKGSSSSVEESDTGLQQAPNKVRFAKSLI